MAVVCAACKTVNRDGALFCKGCGVRLARPADAAPPSSADDEPNRWADTRPADIDAAPSPPTGGRAAAPPSSTTTDDLTRLLPRSAGTKARSNAGSADRAPPSTRHAPLEPDPPAPARGRGRTGPIAAVLIVLLAVGCAGAWYAMRSPALPQGVASPAVQTPAATTPAVVPQSGSPQAPPETSSAAPSAASPVPSQSAPAPDARAAAPSGEAGLSASPSTPASPPIDPRSTTPDPASPSAPAARTTTPSVSSQTAVFDDAPSSRKPAAAPKPVRKPAATAPRATAPTETPPAAEPMPPRPATAASPPAPSSGPADPQSACAGRNFIATAQCMAVQCGRAEFASHPQCAAVRRQQRLEEERRNPTLVN